MELTLDGKCCAKALQKLRFERNISQAELGRRFGGRTHQQISCIESGRIIPQIDTVRQMVYAMGANFEEFARLYEQFLREEMESRNISMASDTSLEYHSSLKRK